jgi:hypothetical protein
VDLSPALIGGCFRKLARPQDQAADGFGRPVYSRMRAVKVTGSPFNTFADAEVACNTMLEVLERANDAQANNAVPLSVNFT